MAAGKMLCMNEHEKVTFWECHYVEAALKARQQASRNLARALRP